MGQTKTVLIIPNDFTFWNTISFNTMRVAISRQGPAVAAAYKSQRS